MTCDKQTRERLPAGAFGWTVCCTILGVLLASSGEGAELGGSSVPKGWVIIEGDILILEETLGTKAAYTTTLWGGGVVPYEFDNDDDDSLSTAQRQMMLDAMAVWEDVANINFRPREMFDTGWLHVRDSSNDADPANSSPVGAGVGERTVNITSWGTGTFDTYVRVHELGHALGLWHEQSRPNRDDYVQINLDRIPVESRHNFDLHATADDYPRGGYDFDSVMHYNQCSFSTCGQSGCSADPDACRTITVLSPWDVDWQDEIGQRERLSRIDALTMSFLYPESDWRIVDAGYDGFFENGTLREPYKTFSKGVEEVSGEGTLWIQPGSYAAAGAWSKPVRLQAPLGGVVLHD